MPKKGVKLAEVRKALLSQYHILCKTLYSSRTETIQLLRHCTIVSGQEKNISGWAAASFLNRLSFKKQFAEKL